MDHVKKGEEARVAGGEGVAVDEVGGWGNCMADGQGRRRKEFRERKIQPRARTHPTTDGYYVALHQGTSGHEPRPILRLVEDMNSSHRNLTQVLSKEHKCK
ncbi:hypothetical protein MA16_Dca015139 [Dendrobium catenatum]|uniref:Uncharacterized protein n=1 Tax=Dendrobium catenatum TaxID=906689 RepID=A0A2I0X4A8_9ASPA|nr:hypothetical protein MA16_Dca015139 [Dendrobium catenatum]